MKKSIAAALFRGSIGLVLVLLAASCGFSGFGPSVQPSATGSLNLIILPDTESRTIAPATADFPAVTKYRVVMSRTGYSTLAQTFTASPCAVTGLEVGSWTVTVEGLSSADVKIASGTTTATIAATGTNSASVTLAYILLAATGKPGSASITLEFPHSVGIDAVTGSLDGTPLTLSVAVKNATTDTVIYSPSSVELGNPRLLITLKKGSVALMYWRERLFVYQGMATTKNITLTALDFALVPAMPTGFIATASSTKVTLKWDSVVVAESYTLKRSDGVGTTYTTLASGSSLAAGTLTYSDTTVTKGTSYSYSLEAVNGYGSSTAATATATIPVSSTTPGLYVVGHSSDANDVLVAGYWVDGAWHSLPQLSTTKMSAARPIVSEGGDLYIGGFCSNDSGVFIPGYWKNGTWVGLIGVAASYNGQVADLVVVGTDVYASGNCKDASGPNAQNIPGYWKNGTWNSLPRLDNTMYHEAFKIVVDGSDVYVSGVSQGAAAVEIPGYWKNGTWVALPAFSTGHYNRALSMAVVGGHIYAVGTCDNSGTSPRLEVACFWKDGVLTSLTPTGTTNSQHPSSIAVVGSDIYVGGEDWVGSYQIPGYWKNGTWTELSRLDSTHSGTVTTIAMLDSSLYAVGSRKDANAVSVAGYWKGGTWTPLPGISTTKNSYAYGILLVQ